MRNSYLQNKVLIFIRYTTRHVDRVKDELPASYRKSTK